MRNPSEERWTLFEVTLGVLAAIGVILPWSSHAQFFASEGGIALGRFFELAYVNLPAAANSNELMIVFLVLVPWMIIEGRRSGISHLWAYVVVAVAVAVAAGFPLFLLARERALHRRPFVTP